jgi:hypothetical protein
MEEVVRYHSDRATLTAAQIKAQVQLIQEVMSAVMKEGHHYGTIPGTPKPTLYKPGAEKLLSTFRIGADPKDNVYDLSTNDEIRYRVAVRGFSQKTGNLLGVGIGECSSNEEKYKWRRPVCEDEFKEAADDRKREVWKNVFGKPAKVKQIRTNPSDVANTVLKMAKKRALVDMTLTITAASDIFDQDLEDMPEELREKPTAGKPPIKEPQKKQTEKPAEKQPEPAENPVIHTVILRTKEWPNKDPKKNSSFQIVGHLDGNEQSFTTFDRSQFNLAVSEEGTNLPLILEYKKVVAGDKTYFNIVSLTREEGPGPGDDAQ